MKLEIYVVCTTISPYWHDDNFKLAETCQAMPESKWKPNVAGVFVVAVAAGLSGQTAPSAIATTPTPAPASTVTAIAGQFVSGCRR